MLADWQTVKMTTRIVSMIDKGAMKSDGKVWIHRRLQCGAANDGKRKGGWRANVNMEPTEMYEPGGIESEIGPACNATATPRLSTTHR